jgi:hypothetical protein
MKMTMKWVAGALVAMGVTAATGYYPQSDGATDSAHSFALQASWLRTQLPNATTSAQNNLTLGAGVAFRLP